jgi:hypothetical protein
MDGQQMDTSILSSVGGESIVASVETQLKGRDHALGWVGRCAAHAVYRTGQGSSPTPHDRSHNEGDAHIALAG